MVSGQVVFSFLPNIEIVSLMVIICTLIYRHKALYIIYAFVLLEGTVWGFGIWWISYLYIWTVLWGAAMIFSKIKSAVFWSVISGVYGLMFGFFSALIQIFIGGIGMAASYWVSGIPFDILHCIGNVAVTLILFKPVYFLLNKLNSFST